MSISEQEILKYTRYQDIPAFIWGGNYTVNLTWIGFERFLTDAVGAGGYDLDPDFQRGHVWTEAKQVAYVEYILRGGTFSKVLSFNHPGWVDGSRGVLQLVDGKQRLEASQAFVRGELKAFGSYIHEYADSFPRLKGEFVVKVNNLKTRAEVLQWYLDINSGGVVHTEEELEKVRRLLLAEKVADGSLRAT